MGKKKTHEQYVAEVAKINPNIEVIGAYINTNTKILHRCKIDNHEWMVRPSSILDGIGCPVCGKHIVGGAPNYINSIWSSEHKEYFSNFLTEEQMKMYAPYSCKYLYATCPDCGNEKLIQPGTLLRYGLGCRCGDGVSFPNKFVYHVLTQLNIVVKVEYSPKWANGYIYDDFLLDYNIIIENHGMQHYCDAHDWAKNVRDEQNNDRIKYELAQKNGIYNYIVLDCRHSSENWIKKSIMDSNLPSLLNFNERDVDWKSATAYASSSLIKKAAALFNNGNNVQQISSVLSVHMDTVRKWLRRATELGWCHYKSRLQKHPVYCIELDTIFPTIKSGAQATGAQAAGINHCCIGTQSYAGIDRQIEQPLHWLYIEDAINLGYVSNITA